MEGFVNFLEFCGKCSVPVVIMAVCLYFLFILLNKQTDHIYNLYYEKFKTELSEEFSKFQKNLDITFRDEEPRSQVISNTIIKADEIRIELYKKTYAMFFEILYSQDKILNADKTDQEKYIKGLYEKVTSLRTELFINSVYLGKLIEYLLPAQIGLWSDIGVIENKINGTWAGLKDDYYKSSEELRNAEHWISDNLKTYLTLNHIDLSEDVIEKLHEQRKEIIDEQIKELEK